MNKIILSRLILLSLLFFPFFSGSAQTQTREELEARRIELQQEIERINDLRTSNLRKEKSVLNQVEDLAQQIRATENLIKVNNQQANLLTREINSNQNKITELREELIILKEDYAEMIRKSYRSESQQSRIMFLLSSESFLQAYKRLQYMKQYANYRHEQGEGIKRRTILLQEMNRNLARQKKAKEELVEENRKRREQLEEDRKAQQSLVAIIRQKEGKFAEQLRQKQSQINEIDRTIERIIAEAIAANNKEKGVASSDVFEMTPAAKALAAEFASNKGKLPWPVRTGVVSMHFGQQRHPVLRNITINSNGVRIDTENNGEAKAVFGGIVSEIQAVPGANRAVMVRHGDYISIYNNLDKIYVKKGESVSVGQALGQIATDRTGKTTLHFLLYKNTEKLNPEEWIYKM